MGKALGDVRFAKAQDVMTKEVAYIDGSATVAKAIGLMRQKGVSSLVVENRSREDAYGIMTRKDVVNKVVDPGKDPAGVRIFL